MTNKELREKLEKLPDDMDVWSKIADQPIDEVYEQNHCDCGEDYPDDFCMDIDDITEDEVKKLDPPKQKDKAEDIISCFIVNQLGINLVAVKDIQVDRQPDGQIKQIKIDFIPDNN